MEPITQALLGAATGHVVAGRTLGRRALGWGAIVGMSPDLDVLLGPLRDGYGEWLYHRGTTHSLWFGFVLGPLLGWVLWRWRDPTRETPLRSWIALAIIALITHPLLDGFTPYGTQFFAPFVRDRFAWNGVAIVDPLYSTLLGFGVLAAARGRTAVLRRRGVLLGLGLSTLYLIFGLFVNRWVENDLRNALPLAKTSVESVRAYPTIFQPWLRSFVVRTPETLYVGLHSWQEAGCPAWQAHPRRASPAIRAVSATWEGELLTWFADGDTLALTTPQPDGTTHVRIEDVRYAWASPDARGLWGLEAKVDSNHEIIGRVRRIGRPAVGGEDFTRILSRLSGTLPEDRDGWQRPSRCLDSPESQIHADLGAFSTEKAR